MVAGGERAGRVEGEHIASKGWGHFGNDRKALELGEATRHHESTKCYRTVCFNIKMVCFMLSEFHLNFLKEREGKKGTGDGLKEVSSKEAGWKEEEVQS